MKYLVMLYANESAMPAPGSPAFDAQNAAYGAVFENFNRLGVFKGGDPVMPSSQATSVQVRDGQRSTRPGPAKDGAEQLIGFYVLECSGADQAEELAATIPCAEVGTVELRPIATM